MRKGIIGMTRRHACTKVALQAAWSLVLGTYSAEGQSAVTARSAGQVADGLAYLLQSVYPPKANDVP